MYSTRLMVGSALCLLSALGCGDGHTVIATGQTLGRSTSGALGLLPDEERLDVAPQMPLGWLGKSIPGGAGTWKHAGEVQVAAANSDDEDPRRLKVTTAAGPPNRKPRSLIFGDSKTRRMYEVEVAPEGLEQVAKVAMKAGYHRGTHVGESIDGDEIVAKGWSAGVDNRIDRGIARFGTSWPYLAIGGLKKTVGLASKVNGCTAAFVGGAGDTNTRYIVSAAHCFWNDSGEYVQRYFWPRNDLCKDNQGNSIAGCDRAPYGEWSVGQWVMYEYYVDNCVGTPDFPAECQADDIVVARVHRLSGSFSDAMPFGYYYQNYLNGVLKSHRGYPGCGSAGDPSPAAPTICMSTTLYGDGAMLLGGSTHLDASGWPRRYYHGSDMSPGHSGGPIYINSGAIVFGVNSSESCSGSDCTGATPNMMRAITEDWFNTMLWFMGL
jgi:hypothetical protein